MRRRAGFYVAPGTTIALGTRGYDVGWEFDSNSDDLELMEIKVLENSANGNAFGARIRHPIRNGSPLLTLELQGEDGQTGFRIGGPTASIADRLLNALFEDSWAWDPAARQLLSFEDWFQGGKPSWAFIADLMAKTSPPTAQPVVCLHSPRSAMIADAVSQLRTWVELLPLPSPNSDSLVRASKDLATILTLPLICEMVSIWNAGFSRPRVLTFQPQLTVERFSTLCDTLGIRVSRVQAETDLPIW